MSFPCPLNFVLKSLQMDQNVIRNLAIIRYMHSFKEEEILRVLSGLVGLVMVEVMTLWHLYRVRLHRMFNSFIHFNISTFLQMFFLTSHLIGQKFLLLQLSKLHRVKYLQYLEKIYAGHQHRNFLHVRHWTYRNTLIG